MINKDEEQKNDLKIFVSKIEELKQANELVFEPTPSFGKYKPLFPEKAVEHPAKMNTNLLEFLIERYTKEGEVILDPMAGTGSTGVLASLHNRNAILVELEKKFVDWIVQTKEKVQTLSTLTPKGEIIVIQGDSRKLSELLSNSQTDIIITSPPYSEGQFDCKHGMNKYVSPNWKGRKAFEERRKMEYSENNITLLKHGNVDAIITSPPYEGSVLSGGDPERRKERLLKAGYNPKEFLGGKARNAMLKHYDEVDTIITSPPYSESMTKKRKGYTVIPELAKTREMSQDTRDDNIANLSHGNIDAIITSPPYAEANKGGGIAQKGYEGKYGKDEKLHLRHDRPLSNNPDNIGNMKKETYLQAMLQVYKEMYSVLKEGGRAIVVIKPFTRNKKVVDLPYQTWLLLQKAGFQLEDVFKLRLDKLSFWRILQYKKNPEQEQIRHEYILVVRK
jgi:DNA modification methylase